MTTQTQCELMSANEPQFDLTATPVPDEQRLDFWPLYFGAIPQWITLEPRIFAWMDRFCDEYSGGIWSFLRSAMAARLWPLTLTINGICSTA
jgi:hypothetical protein